MLQRLIFRVYPPHQELQCALIEIFLGIKGIANIADDILTNLWKGFYCR